MELNSWTLVEQDGDHVLHNSNSILHGTLMHSVSANPNTDCPMMPIDICQENASRVMNRVVMDRRMNQGL